MLKASIEQNTGARSEEQNRCNRQPAKAVDDRGTIQPFSWIK